MSRAAQQGRLVVPAVGLALLILVLTVLSTGIVPGVPAMLRPFDLSGVRAFSVGQPFAVGGATIQSIDCQIPVGETSLSGRKCIITAAVTGGSDRVVLGKSELQGKSGKEWKWDLTLDFVPHQQKAIYEIISSGQQASTYGYIFKEGWEDFPGKSFVCPSTNLGWSFLAQWDNYQWPSNDWTVWSCVYSTQAGSFGDVQLKTITSGADVTLTAGGKVATSTVTNYISSSTGLTAPLSGAGGGDTIKYSGDLVTWDQPPAAARYAGFYNKGEARWRIIGDSMREDYRNARDSAQQNLNTIRDECQPTVLERVEKNTGDNDCHGGKAGVAILLDGYIRDNEAILNDQIRRTDLQIIAGQVMEVATEQKASLTVPLTVRVGNPVVTITVDAEWAGVLSSPGVPKVSVDGACSIQSGAPSSVPVTVSNIGSGPGRFAISSSCGGNVGASGFSGILDLAPGASRTISVSTTSPLAGSTSQCTFNAQDLASGKIASSAATCTVTAAVECISGSIDHSGQQIMECRLGKWVVTATCSGDQIVERSATGSGLSCVDIAKVVEQAGSGAAIPEEVKRAAPLAETKITCDILCKLGRVNPLVWVILAVAGAVIGGLIYTTRRRP